MQISAEYNDNPGGSGIDTGLISLIIDGIDVTQDAMITGGSISIKPALNDGLHEILLSVGDNAGNNATDHWNFTLDATPPEIDISNISVMTNQTVYPAIKVIDTRDVKPIIKVLLNGAGYDGMPVADEGEYELTVTASDDAGNTAMQSINFTIDNTPPAVGITYPINGTFVGNIVNITGITSDLHMEKTLLEIDGITVSNSAEYIWDSRKVTDGTHKIRLNAQDKAGNAAGTSIVVIVDNTQPDIFDLDPQDNSIVNSTYSIFASYNDTGSGIDINSFSIWIDGVDQTENSVVTGSSMQYKPSLQDGMHIVKMSVNDTVGNNRIITTSFELDTTSPETEIIFPSNNSYSRQTITISGSASDLHLDLVFIEIDGIKVSSTSNYAWDTTLVIDRSHEIKLNAVDIVKNSASSSINVIVDNTPPVIQITPANGTVFYPDKKLTIDYNVSDATSGVASSSVSLDGIAVSKGDIIDLRNLSIGGHIIRVIAIDNAGNNADSSTTFIVKPLRSIVKIEPRTLNINSSGRWIKAEIEIPEYEANQINISSIRLNGIIPVVMEIEENDEIDDETEIYDSLEKDDSELKVKFDRMLVQSIISPGYATLYISGKVNEAAFMGNDTIRVVQNGKKDSDHSEKEDKSEKNFDDGKRKGDLKK